MIIEKTLMNNKLYTLDTIRFQFLVRTIGVIVAVFMMLLSDYPFDLGLNVISASVYMFYAFVARYTRYKDNKLFQKYTLYIDITVISLFIGIRGGLRSDFYLGYYIVLGYVLLIRNKKLIRNVSLHIIGFYALVAFFTSSEFSLERLLIRCVMMSLTMVCFYMYAKILSDETSKRLRISEIALTDRLTGLYNRHILDSIDDLIIEKRIFVLIDIDDFKIINDEYGHITGDRVLKDLGQLILQMMEKDELAIRYGGEEFLLILDCNRQESLERIQKLSKKFFNVKYDFLDCDLTFSAGVFEKSVDCTFEQALHLTDMKLYKAKESGKNQVI
ncbi:GGDEF domain-containing protein [Acidaminobacter sp. JC074]|uniref:GGDEF domain-containing protein n=1 Tax=Acidaminobacter sp. JC074 TaxID=2530199 RepID=UPI001F0E99E7|nr:GGDEF domain-containing protein [Acidaminobacter sp. JC074]MCH4888095.1 GGDEF domain-containing protein [Acidaminobacter sp. JC074]